MATLRFRLTVRGQPGKAEPGRFHRGESCFDRGKSCPARDDRSFPQAARSLDEDAGRFARDRSVVRDFTRPGADDRSSVEVPARRPLAKRTVLLRSAV